MPIAAPPRKALVVRKITAERPDLTPGEIAKLAGVDRGYAAKALKAPHMGRDKPKSRVRGW